MCNNLISELALEVVTSRTYNKPRSVELNCEADGAVRIDIQPRSGSITYIISTSGRNTCIEKRHQKNQFSSKISRYSHYLISVYY